MPEGFEVGEAYVRIRPRADGSFESDVERQITGPLLSQARKLAGVFAVGAIAKGGLDELKQQAQVGAQTAAVIRSTGAAAQVSAQHVSDNAKAIEKLSGKDKEAVQAGENLLLTFRSVRNQAGAGNDVFDRATTLATDLSVAWGQDLTSSAIQVGKALEDPKLGMVALRRVGITFTEDQRKVITSLEDTGQHLEAQKMILAELEKQVGGSAKAYGETLPGKLERAKNAWDDMTASIVSGAAPALETAADLVRPVVDLVSKLPSPLQAAAVAAGALAIAGKWDAMVTGAKALGTAVDALAIDFTAAGYAGAAAEAAMTLGIGAAIAGVIALGNEMISTGNKAAASLGAENVNWKNTVAAQQGVHDAIDKTNALWDKYTKAKKEAWNPKDVLDAKVAFEGAARQTDELVKHYDEFSARVTKVKNDLGLSTDDANKFINALAIDPTTVDFVKYEQVLGRVARGEESAAAGADELAGTTTKATDAADKYAAARWEANSANTSARDATRTVEDAQGRLNDITRQAADLTRQHATDVRALADAQRAVADVQDRINHIPRDQAQAQLDLRDATLSVGEAQARLASAKPEDRARAQIDLERAQLRVADAQDAVNKANGEGETYARDLANAQQGVADAQQRIADEGPAATKLAQDRTRAEQDLATALDNQALAMYVLLQLTNQMNTLRQQAEQQYLTPNTQQAPPKSYLARAGGGPTAPHSTYQINEVAPEMYSEGGKDYLRTGSKGGTVSAAPKAGLVYAPTFNVHGHTAEQALKQANDDAFFGLSMLGSGVA